MKYFNRIQNGIISIRSLKNWKKQLDFITKKSGAYTNALDVLNIFEVLIRNAMGGFSPQSIVDKINSTPGAELVYNQDGYVMAYIFTYESSRMLGSSSWCISRWENHFINYSTNRQQLFLWDTNKQPSDNHSLMGMTINNNGSLHTSHLKNDTYFDCREYIKKLLNNKSCDRSLYSEVFSKLISRSPKVQLFSSLYNGSKLSSKIFIEVFDSEWKSSPKDSINDFKGLFEIYIIFLEKNNHITLDIIKNAIKLNNIHENLKNLSLNMELDEVLYYYYNMREITKRNVMFDILSTIIKHRDFNKLSTIDKAILYMRSYKFIDIDYYNSNNNKLPKIIDLDLRLDKNDNTISDLHIGK